MSPITFEFRGRLVNGLKRLEAVGFSFLILSTERSVKAFLDTTRASWYRSDSTDSVRDYIRRLTMMRLQVVLTLILATFCVSQANAQAVPGRMGVGIYGGAVEGDATYESGAAYELRYSYSPKDFFSVELSLGMVDSVMLYRKPGQADTVAYTPQAPRDARWLTTSVSTLFFISASRLHPYLLAGVGTLTDEETYLMGSLGLGAGYAIDTSWSARLEGKALLSENAPATDRFQHLQISAGVMYEWGGEADLDNDGVPNLKDQCRNDPEDKDGFEDFDGCPDFDNDEDGIDDDEDKCPLKKEDKDDDRDDDGCPDEDKDKDGIEDIDDQCIDEAEDKDGFEDEDGCPDTDNDSDGIDDSDDKCPLKAEDQDSFEDDDGCPEADNDNDGVLDAQDKCPTLAGTENGCPAAKPAEETSEE
jgi:hypothetical protein